MELIVTLILGGVIGWLASLVMNRDAQQGVLLNVAVGVVGAFVGNFFARMFGSEASISEFSVEGLFWAFVGAVALLALVNAITRRSLT